MTMPDRRKIRWSFIVFFIPVFLWLLLLIVLPQIELLRMSFVGNDFYGDSGFTLRNYGAFFSDPIYWLTFVRTTGYALLVTFIVLIIALPGTQKIAGMGDGPWNVFPVYNFPAYFTDGTRHACHTGRKNMI